MDIIELVTRAYADGELAIQPPNEEECDSERFHDKYVVPLYKTDVNTASDMENCFYRMFTNTTEKAFADGLAVGMSLSGTIAQKMGVSA